MTTGHVAQDRPAATAGLFDLFRGKAQAIGATVAGAADEAAAAELLAAAGAVATRALDARFPGIAARLGRPPSLPEAAPDAATAGAFAVAETGSVAVCEASAADRAACWLAERLWLVVPAADMVPTLDAALERVAALVREGASYVTLMSGPSRTADIERTLTIGVHGPRELTIVVVGAGGPA